MVQYSYMDRKEVQKRLLAAYSLLAEPTTTREKFNHVSTLIRGIHPHLDSALERSHEALSTLDKIVAGDVITLSAEHLPENTEEEKRRKKYLLLFIHSWKDLQSEVSRVSAEFQNQAQTPAQQGSRWWRIVKGAKGPLGVITVVAVGLVALQTTSVQVTIQNKGCETLYPSGSIPSIPGFSLPKDPIASGSSAVMTIPPLSLHVDGTKKGTMLLSALNYSFTFELPGNVTDVTLDGAHLLGATTDVHLSDAKEHTLVLRCN